MSKDFRALTRTAVLWKMKTPASFVGTGTVLVLALLCRGTLSQISLFTLSVNSLVSVQRGLYVDVPCNFTYDKKLQDQGWNLYGYWLKLVEGEETYFGTRNNFKRIPGRLVATNEEAMTHQIHQSALNHFQLTGDLERGSCSFRIKDARLEDRGTYYFRLESGYYFKYGYIDTTLQVLVTDRPNNMKITTSIIRAGKTVLSSKGKDLVAREGDTVNLLCQVEAIPDPILTWMKENKTLGTIVGKEHQYPLLKIRPEDAGEYRCHAENSAGSTSKRVQLDVHYPPRNMTLHVFPAYRKDPILTQGLPVEVPNGTQLTAEEGDSLHLYCKTDSNPPAKTTWVSKGGNILRSSANWLNLTSLTLNDEGDYECMAANMMVSLQANLHLNIACAPKPSTNGPINTSCLRTHNSILCNCSLHAKPPPQIQWHLNGKIITEQSSQHNLTVNTLTQGNEVTSSLRWTGSLEGDQSIICYGSNYVGVYTVHFQLIDLKTGNHTAWLLPGLCGILVAVTIFMIGLWISKLYKQKKTSSKADTVENMDSVSVAQPRAGNSSRIYGNIFPMGKKTPHINHSTVAGTQVSPGHARNGTASESGELHYASLEFKAKNKSIPVIMEDSVEYSEVRRK